MTVMEERKAGFEGTRNGGTVPQFFCRNGRLCSCYDRGIPLDRRGRVAKGRSSGAGTA